MGTFPSPLLKVVTYVSVKAKYARERDDITPRNGCELIVCVVARISGCPGQKELSLEDQIDHAKEVVAEYYAGPVELRIVATKGKGENLERPELALIEQQLRTRELDLLVCEDLGRLVRGGEAGRLCGIAVDHGTRVLAPNDCFDTNDPDFETDLLSICRDHVGANIHTSKRIKQKKMNRFRKFGGATPTEIAGYLKPEDAKIYDDWQKIDEATSVIQEGLQLLKETLNCSQIADFFNERGFKPGPYSRRQKWDGKMVRRFYGNMLLAGRPGRGYRHTIKHHERGKRISVPNPDGPEFIDCPHLAHVDHDELVEVNERLRQKNSSRGRKKVNGVDPRYQVPRKRTVYPSQHARCFYCGCTYIRGGNGIRGHIGCANIRDWQCWNTIGVSCEMAGLNVMKAIRDFLYDLDGFDEQFKEMVEQAHREQVGVSAEQWRQLDTEDAKCTRELGNLIDAVKMFGPTAEIKAELDAVKQRQQQLARERRALEKVTKRELQLPGSIAELREVFESKANGLAVASPEFGDLMRQLTPEFHIYLVRILDGGPLYPRARVKLDLTGCIADFALVPEMTPFLTRVVTLDLFEPPQRERIREAAVRLEATGTKQRDIAKKLPEKTFQVVVFKALALNRLMVERGLSGPYEIMMEPPSDYTKLRRHLNPRYQFRPLDGYGRPQL